MKILFYLVFALELGLSITLTDWIYEKIKYKYKHKKLHNIIGSIVAVTLFVISVQISYPGWLNLDLLAIIIGFVLLLISILASTFIQKKRY